MTLSRHPILTASSSESSPPVKTADAKTYGTSGVPSTPSDISSHLSRASTPDVDVETAPQTEDVDDFPKQLSARKHVAKTISVLLIGKFVAFRNLQTPIFSQPNTLKQRGA